MIFLEKYFRAKIDRVQNVPGWIRTINLSVNSRTR